MIDDDPHQRAVAALVLSEAGHQLREASDGAEGLRLALEQPPELVVCDVVMPGMNGYQFVAAVRADAGLCTTPVILLTSLSGRAQVRTGMTTGADDYLLKPFEPPELLEAVHSLLERRRTQHDAIAGTVRLGVDEALAEQREQLAARYESQLLQELNARWKAGIDAGVALDFDVATVLLADVYSVLEHEGSGRAGGADLLRRAHEAASDALYLFGAVHVLPHGEDVLAVFPPTRKGQPELLRPLRAAWALQSAIGALLGGETGDAPQLAVAMDIGPLALVRLQDPLHGDAGVAPVPGATLQRLQALRSFAQQQAWPVVAPEASVGLLSDGAALTGRRSGALPDLGGAAVELLRPRQP
nr:response regulator [Ramlibacter algicola]